MKKVLIASILTIIALSFYVLPQVSAISQDQTPSYIQYTAPNGTIVLAPYKLTQNTTGVYYESKEGSYFFNSATCALSKYPGGLIGNSSPQFTDSYEVLVSSDGTTFNPVTSINSASCSTTISNTGTSESIFGTRSASGIGVFSINYTKVPTHDLKITISATNNNPTSYYLGGIETLSGLSQFVTLGNVTYDLSLYNNTVLSRSWISSHNAQLIQLDKITGYTMGIGWNHVDSIKIIWNGSKASLLFYYTYNAPFLATGHTIIIDPSITKDATGGFASSPSSYKFGSAITLGSNQNRILIVQVSDSSTVGGTPPTIHGVLYNGVNMTLVPNTMDVSSDGALTNSRSAFYYLIAPATGTHQLQGNFSAIPTYTNIGYFSLYNVNQVTGVQNGNATHGNGIFGDHSWGIEVTPTKTGSWTLAAGTIQSGTGGYQGPDTQAWYQATNVEDMGSYNSSPSIGSKNFMYFDHSYSLPWAASGVEVLVPVAPTTPTLTHANTLNSTAIQLDWPAVSGASGYLINMTTPFGGTYTQIANQSSNTLIKNGITPGSQYAFKVAAYNSTGTSTFSNIKSNYTTNIAPTGLTTSMLTPNSVRVSAVNPTGNFSGYNIYSSVNSGPYVLAGTSSNSTNRFDLLGLLGNHQYGVEFATRYAVGTNSSGVSANSAPVIFTTPNATAFTWNTVGRDATHFDQFVDISNNGTAVSWFRGVTGSGTLTKVLGYGQSSITLLGTPNVDTNNLAANGFGFQSNGGNIYVVNTAKSVDHYYVGNGTRHHDFTVAVDSALGLGKNELLVNQASKPIWQSDSGINPSHGTSLSVGNYTINAGNLSVSSQQILNSTQYVMLWEFNDTKTTTGSSGGTPCALYQINNNFTTTVMPDTIGCDFAIQQSIKKFYFGIPVYKQGNYYTGNAQQDLFSITDSLPSTTKQLLTVDNNIIGLPNNTPNVRFILHSTAGDYLIVVTSTTIYYQLASTISSVLFPTNTILQSYQIVPNTVTPTYPVSTLAAKNTIKIYGNVLNATESQMGLDTILSGYTIKGASSESSVRTVDPRWTYDGTDIPALVTTSSLYQMFITVSNSPNTAAIKVGNPLSVINGIESIWSVVILDATHSAEVDIPNNLCADVSVANVAVTPIVWVFQGQLCSIGINQKTIQYTNTVPLAFFTMTYGATSSYTPTTNTLTVTTRSTAPSFTENVVIKNSTGAVSQNVTTVVSGQLSTQTFNVTNTSKPATLFVSIVGKGVIYSSYLGSSLSFASVSSFFHQYLSYQGFDLLSFIPIIFAGMFTRNTVGIGAGLVVTLIATLSFLSVVVVSDTVIGISIIIAIISGVGYRSLYS